MSNSALEFIKVHSIYSDLNDQMFRMNKINEIKDYFIVEICERELMSKRIYCYLQLF